jgi:hypothetical protein
VLDEDVECLCGAQRRERCLGVLVSSGLRDDLASRVQVLFEG